VRVVHVIHMNASCMSHVTHVHAVLVSRALHCENASCKIFQHKNESFDRYKEKSSYTYE